MKIEILNLDDLIEVNDAIGAIVMEDRAPVVETKLAKAGDLVREAMMELSDGAERLRPLAQMANVDVDEYDWLKFVLTWVATYVVEDDGEPTLIEKEGWN